MWSDIVLSATVGVVATGLMVANEIIHRMHGMAVLMIAVAGAILGVLLLPLTGLMGGFDFASRLAMVVIGVVVAMLVVAGLDKLV